MEVPCIVPVKSRCPAVDPYTPTGWSRPRDLIQRVTIDDGSKGESASDMPD